MTYEVEKYGTFIFNYEGGTRRCIIENDGFSYKMPYVYSLTLKRFLRTHNVIDNPIDTWYSNLSDIEKKIVDRQKL
jgi:hypothetical protein